MERKALAAQEEKDAQAVESRKAQSEQAKQIGEIIDEALSCGTMTHKVHDRMLRRIHADGTIDPAEKEHLSRLFSFIHAGKIALVDEDAKMPVRSKKENEAFSKAKQEALERDETRVSRDNRPVAVAAKPDAVAAANAANGTTATVPQAATPLPASTPQNETVPQSGIGFGQAKHKPFTAQPEVDSQPADDLSIQALFDAQVSRRTSGKAFELRSDRLLDVNLNGKVWMRTGAMVAYTGTVRFTREGLAEHGITKLIKKTVTGEGTMLTKATGQGSLYLADRGKKISIIDLKGHTLVVNGTSLLAFEETVQWDITMLRQFAAIWAGGFFNVRMSGNGLVAVTTVGDPVMLRVTQSEPLMTDASATVAWSGSLLPQFKTDIAMNTLIGRTSGETLQMRFDGDGFVIIQPFEEVPITPPPEKGT